MIDIEMNATRWYTTGRMNNAASQEMKYKPTRFEVPPENPFTNDVLSRQESAGILTQFVDSLSESFVLAIDSPWGTGKTTFLNMWSRHLQNEGFRVLLFNAWENDFSDSPLLSLIGEIESSLKNLKDSSTTNNTTEAADKIKNIGLSLAKAALPTLVKIATSGVLDLSQIKNEDISKLAEECAQKQLEKYKHDKESIKGFHKKLAEAVISIGTHSGKPQVIFIIDELDRCRPNYAVELLEKIKHLFNVPNLIFVLALDKSQLSEAIKSVYGTGIDTDGYLRRFIDLEYHLPLPDVGQFVQNLFTRFGFDGRLNQQEYHHLNDVLTFSFKLFNFSLRSQEQCFTQLAVCLRTTPRSNQLIPYHLGFLICLRAKDRNFYEKYVAGDISPNEVREYLRKLPRGNELVGSETGAIIEGHLVVGIRDESKRNQTINDWLSRPNPQVLTPENQREHSVKSTISSLRHLNHLNLTDYISKKIEISHHFQ